MKQGPFELWQEAGWTQVAQWIKEDIDAGKALSQRAAAGVGVRGPGGRSRRRAHARRLVERRRRTRYVPRRASCRCTSASCSPRACSAPARPTPLKSRHRAVQERRDPRLDARRRGADRQHHRQAAPDQPGGDRGPAARRSSSPRSKYKGLVIWSPDDVFSAGANLEALMPVFMKMRRQGHRARGEEAAGRDAAHALRAGAGGLGAMRGIALGGGCELAMSLARKRVARDGKLHRPGRSRRRPDARRRRPDLHRAPRGRERPPRRPAPTCCAS